MRASSSVVVGAHLQADDAVHVLDLGGEHDDGRGVVGRAQAAADAQAVFAGQHEVEHDEIDRLAREHAVQRLGVLGQQDVEAFLGQVAPQQVADARVVVDDHDAVGAGVGGRAHGGLQICNRRIVRCATPAFWREMTGCYMSFRRPGRARLSTPPGAPTLCLGGVPPPKKESP
jgi:hypothetical protein